MKKIVKAILISLLLTACNKDSEVKITHSCDFLSAEIKRYRNSCESLDFTVQEMGRSNSSHIKKLQGCQASAEAISNYKETETCFVVGSENQVTDDTIIFPVNEIKESLQNVERAYQAYKDLEVERALEEKKKMAAEAQEEKERVVRCKTLKEKLGEDIKSKFLRVSYDCKEIYISEAPTDFDFKVSVYPSMDLQIACTEVSKRLDKILITDYLSSLRSLTSYTKASVRFYMADSSTELTKAKKRFKDLGVDILKDNQTKSAEYYYVSLNDFSKPNRSEYLYEGSDTNPSDLIDAERFNKIMEKPYISRINIIGLNDGAGAYLLGRGNSMSVMLSNLAVCRWSNDNTTKGLEDLLKKSFVFEKVL